MQPFCTHYCTLFLVHSIMATSGRGCHVESLPPKQEAPTVIDDVDGFEGGVTPFPDDEDAEPLTSVGLVSLPCLAPTTTTGKKISVCVCRLDMKCFLLQFMSLRALLKSQFDSIIS